MLLQTEILKVRTFRDSDYTDVHEYLSKPSVYKYEPGEVLDLFECKKLVKARATGNTFLAIELLTEKKVIGHLYFYQLDPKNLLTWELGFITNPGYQRKGYTSQAADLLMDYAFNILGAHRITAQCNPENIASWKLLEKIGMSREGYLKKNIYFNETADGKPIWQDTYLYAKLKLKI